MIESKILLSILIPNVEIFLSQHTSDIQSRHIFGLYYLSTVRTSPFYVSVTQYTYGNRCFVNVYKL